MIGPTGAEIRPVKGLSKNLVYELPLVPELFNSCQTGLMGISTRTGLMGISTRSFQFQGKCKGNSFQSVKSVKISFKHSIEWHLKEIKEFKRPKNLITFCFHSSSKTSFVIRPAAGCLRALKLVELIFFSRFQTFYYSPKVHTG
jgi:hypothetical protein